MFRTKQRLLSAVFALVLVLALSVTAFAVWPSFQGHVDNNGVIAVQPPITTPSVTPVSLTGGGIESTSVINNGVAYTLYNGGTPSGAAGGARLRATTLANPPTQFFDIQIDPSANNIQQLSTPYLDTAANTLYVATSSSAAGNDYWKLWSVSNVNTPTPTVTPLATGAGQANTPISAAADTKPAYIYFGSYSGARTGSYYQYGITASPGTLATFAPPKGDDFYLAGAAFVNIPGEGLGDCVVFGGDRATIYVRPINAFATGTGNAVTLVDLVNSPGPVRSSIVKNGDFVYFTSGGSWNAILWQILVTDLDNSATINDINNYNMKAYTSTSTPVISDKGYIYVGSYNNDGTGLVEAYTPGDGVNTPPALAAVIYNPGDAVRSSPIVYTDGTGTWDYIYFTTYSASGAGYCYRYNGTNAQQRWATTGNAQAFQGFASDGGYLVYGDDSNNLYIIS
jgi:hypothetical protein